MNKPLVFLAALLSGCSSLSGMNQAILSQGEPIAMCRLSTAEGYIVQSGLPIPIGQRFKEIDSLCSALRKVEIFQNSASAPAK